MLAIETALSFAWRHWKLICGGLVVIGLSIALAIAQGDVRHWHKQFDHEVDLHELDNANWLRAQVQAERDALANVARVTTQQQQITETTIAKYETRLASSASAYERLRARAAAYQSATSSPDLSATREGACFAFTGSRCDELPAKLKAAQDNTDQLIALQDWVRQQERVR